MGVEDEGNKSRTAALSFVQVDLGFFGEFHDNKFVKRRGVQGNHWIFKSHCL